MDACEVKRRIIGCGLVAMVRTASAADARTASAALAAGGVEIIEITMTVPGALAVIEGLTKEFGTDVVVGAGTVMDAETARAAILAGAEFIVTPALSEGAIRVARGYGKLACPGALTPTEIAKALECGADLVKVFPVDCVGGPEYIRAIKAPFPQAELVPTGGVTLENAAEYIRAGGAALGVGSALVDKRALAEGKPEVLTEKARRFVEAVRAARM